MRKLAVLTTTATVLLALGVAREAQAQIGGKPFLPQVAVLTAGPLPIISSWGGYYEASVVNAGKKAVTAFVLFCGPDADCVTGEPSCQNAVLQPGEGCFARLGVGTPPAFGHLYSSRVFLVGYGAGAVEGRASLEAAENSSAEISPPRITIVNAR
jgi:hypothetical protein